MLQSRLGVAPRHAFYDAEMLDWGEGDGDVANNVEVRVFGSDSRAESLFHDGW
jgi:hypothetical protein